MKEADRQRDKSDANHHRDDGQRPCPAKRMRPGQAGVERIARPISSVRRAAETHPEFSISATLLDPEKPENQSSVKLRSAASNE